MIKSCLSQCKYIAILSMALCVQNSMSTDLYQLDGETMNLNNNRSADNFLKHSSKSELINKIKSANLPDNNYSIGTEIGLPIPNNKKLKGRVIREFDDNNFSNQINTDNKSNSLTGTEKKLIVSLGKDGVAQLFQKNGTIEKATIYYKPEDTYYSVDLGNQNNGLYLDNSNIHICYQFPAANSGSTAHSYGHLSSSKEIGFFNESESQSNKTLTVSKLKKLQSKPGAKYVLFVDFWGGVVRNSYWNDAKTNGSPITYTPYSEDSNSNSFSQSERNSMEKAINIVAEDFAYFDINITTDVSVFDKYNERRRGRIYATTSSSWYGSSGGVALVDGFGNDDDYYNGGWVWNTGLNALSSTISHEFGHVLSLTHDGNTHSNGYKDQYYSGHGNWNTIMGGSPFIFDYVQWSKGDYPNYLNDNGKQNDLKIIAQKLNTTPDDYGNNTSSAKLIKNNQSIKGLIQANGLSKDTDVFKFKLTGENNAVDVNVEPYLISQGESTGANLSIEAKLINNSGKVIARSKLNYNNQRNNKLDFQGELAAGVYYVIITNKSPDTTQSNGFPEYSNGGFYQLSLEHEELHVPKPDLEIVEADRPPDQVIQFTAGQSIQTNTEIKNIGDKNSENGKLVVKIERYDGKQKTTLGSVDIPTISIDSTKSVENLITIPDIFKGIYNFLPCIVQVSGERNFENNCLAPIKVNILESSTPKSDLDIIYSTQLSKETIHPGSTVTMQTVIINKGLVTSTAGNIVSTSYNSISKMRNTDPLKELPSIRIGFINHPVTIPQGLIGEYQFNICIEDIKNEAEIDNNCSIAILNIEPDPNDCDYFSFKQDDGTTFWACL